MAIVDSFVENVVIKVADETGEGKPVVIANDIMENATVEHKRGRLVEMPAPAPCVKE